MNFNKPLKLVKESLAKKGTFWRIGLNSASILSKQRSQSHNAVSIQGNRVLTKEHLEEVVLDPTGFKPFTLDTPFESGFLLQHIEGNLA